VSTSDGAVPLAVNRGTPLVLTDRKSDFARAIDEMAKRVRSPEPPKQKRKGLFRATVKA
jgi:Flp pilus assembly CpaE family ATPase